MALGIPTKIDVYPQNDLVVDIEGLADVITEILQNGGTATATLYDQRGNTVPEFTNISLAALGSGGNYRGTVLNTLNPNPGGGYWLVVTAVVSGIQWRRGFPVEIKKVSQSS